MLNLNIGKVLKEARQKKELTLENLSGKCGYSKALISRIENDSVSPSLESLTKIAEALDLRLFDIFASVASDEPLVLKKGERDRFVVAKGEYEIEFLTSAARMMQPTLVFLNGGAEARGRDVHNGDKFLHVMTGKTEVTVGERAYILKAGDTIYFKSMIPHKLRGVGKAQAVSLAVTYVPYH